MIYSDKQYGVSTAELEKLREALAATEARGAEDDWVRRIEIDGLKSQIAEMEDEISRYDLLKAGGIAFSGSYAIENLRPVLAQARIASGMSQADLAKALNLQPRQIQRYEATDYMGASLARLIDISKILNIRTTGLSARA